MGDIMIFFFFISIVMLVAWLMSINLLIKVGAAKGYRMDNSELLWFIGIFATPIVLGLYICALPDNRPSSNSSSNTADSTPAAEELPSV